MGLFTSKNTQEHDRNLFLQSEEQLPEEVFTAFLQTLADERSFQGAVRTRVLDFMKFHENPANAFRIGSLQERMKELLEALRELRTVTAVHFLVFPRNQTGTDLKHCLHPDYFVLEMHDISLDQHEFFLSAEQQLKQFVARTTAAYKAFRKAARRKLKV